MRSRGRPRGGARRLAATLFWLRNMTRIRRAMPSSPDRSPLTDAEFHRLASAVLASIEAAVDEWLQDDIVDIDSQRTGGMLELSFPNGSKIVVNTQPPL